ncbi:hypothetical protein TNCV_139521 [Trichonephila clavipes]|uniref:Uncharacterized protein n=1 Tax=Trichonephila clavipes TaxID=2585209 RepID=A0A8X6RDI6_TRICX|nr:hypothetical protein TNCV_139521 [Trichonephila clavipes]
MVKVTDSYLACHDFDPSTTEDPLSTRGLLVMDLVSLKHGQMMRATPELAPPSPNFHTKERTFQISIDLTCITALHGGPFVALGSNSRHANHDSIP